MCPDIDKLHGFEFGFALIGELRIVCEEENLYCRNIMFFVLVGKFLHKSICMPHNPHSYDSAYYHRYQITSIRTVAWMILQTFHPCCWFLLLLSNIASRSVCLLFIPLILYRTTVHITWGIRHHWSSSMLESCCLTRKIHRRKGYSPFSQVKTSVRRNKPR